MAFRNPSGTLRRAAGLARRSMIILAERLDHEGDPWHSEQEGPVLLRRA